MPDKKEAVGPDGLTKKQRRALRVQEKQAQQKPAENGSSKPEIPVQKVAPAAPVVKKRVENKPAVVTNTQANQIADPKKTDAENMSKSVLRALRREKQEAQRLAKQNKLAAPEVNKENIKQVVEKPAKVEIKVEAKKPVKKEVVKKVSTVNKVQLVQHLYLDKVDPEYDNFIVNYKNVHPAFIKLGAEYSTKTILGSNARCLALLEALKHLVDDLQTPPKQEFCRYLESVLQSCTSYLQYCRPFAVSMTNALRNFKLQLTQIDSSLSDNEKKARLIDVIEVYVKDDIHKAGDAISIKVNEKINNGDIILTYGCSSLIKKILIDAHREGKQFEVVVVDGRPLLEGRELLRRLISEGIKCTYVLINSVSYVMSSATKVLLGAHALLANGFVMARIGTAQVALVAQAYNKPVLVCCETYKFSERVQMDSFVYNEIGDDNKLTRIDTLQEESPLAHSRDSKNFSSLNLLYDVTPTDMVTAVVTEIAILPCTSVPVVLRIHAN